jgi:hypothetical protein
LLELIVVQQWDLAAHESSNGFHGWNSLLGNNVIQQPPLLEQTGVQQWDLGSQKSKNDLGSLLEDNVVQQ